MEKTKPPLIRRLLILRLTVTEPLCGGVWRGRGGGNPPKAYELTSGVWNGINVRKWLCLSERSERYASERSERSVVGGKMLGME